MRSTGSTVAMRERRRADPGQESGLVTPACHHEPCVPFVRRSQELETLEAVSRVDRTGAPGKAASELAPRTRIDIDRVDLDDCHVPIMADGRRLRSTLCRGATLSSMDSDTSDLTPSELVKVVCPKIRDSGWAYYFASQTIARGEELGLDVYTFYFMGRGGVLGDVEWPVVHSAFGYFNPEVVRNAWNSGREKVAPREAGRAYMECCRQLGRSRLSGLDCLQSFCAAADAVNDAASELVPGLALYAATSAEPLADDLPGRAMQLVAVLRELRGSAHLLSIVASGLTPKEAHYLRRPGDFALFGWSDGDIPTVGNGHRARLDAAEALTDELVLPAYSVLDPAGAAALLGGMESIEAALKA